MEIRQLQTKSDLNNADINENVEVHYRARDCRGRIIPQSYKGILVEKTTSAVYMIAYATQEMDDEMERLKCRIDKRTGRFSRPKVDFGFKTSQLSQSAYDDYESRLTKMLREDMGAQAVA